MDLSRRQIIKGIGAAIIAGVAPKFVAELVGGHTPVNYCKLIYEKNFGPYSDYKTFAELLNEYMPYDLLVQELDRPHWLLEKVSS